MTQPQDLETIKKLTAEFLEKMTVPFSDITVKINTEDVPMPDDASPVKAREVVDVMVFLSDPKILIGQGGQTLVEVQRILRIMLNKKLASGFYVNLDINDYKLKKTEYLKTLAREAATEVSLTKQKKEFPPMSSYERRILHKELSKMTDIISQSQGEADQRHIVIIPK